MINGNINNFSIEAQFINIFNPKEIMVFYKIFRALD